MNSEIIAVLSAIKDSEEHGCGGENIANPSGIPAVIALGSKAERDYLAAQREAVA